jgi:hypothetical protein
MSNSLLSYITKVAVIANFERRVFLDFQKGWTLPSFNRSGEFWR